MRHRMGGRKLALPSDQRRALLRSLVSAVFLHDEIITTEARAKEAARLVDKVITQAKRNDLHSRRLVQRAIFEQNETFQGSSDKSHRDMRSPHLLLRRIFEELAPLYKEVRGGYTRITRIGARRGDAAMMVRLELTKGVSLGNKGGRKASKRQGGVAAVSALPPGRVASAAEPATESNA